MRKLFDKLERAMKYLNYNYEKFIVSNLGKLLLGNEINGYDYNPLKPKYEEVKEEKPREDSLLEKIKKDYKPIKQLSISYVNESGDLFLKNVNPKYEELYDYLEKKGFNETILNDIIIMYKSLNGRKELITVVCDIEYILNLDCPSNKKNKLIDLYHYKQNDFSEFFIEKEAKDEDLILSLKSFFDIAKLRIEGLKYEISEEDEEYLKEEKEKHEKSGLDTLIIR